MEQRSEKSRRETREEMMKPHPYRSTENAGSIGDNLLRCRMAVLHLDIDAIERGDRKTFGEIARRCTQCEFGDACAVDMRRDSNNPVWEAYCANSKIFNALTLAWR